MTRQDRLTIVTAGVMSGSDDWRNDDEPNRLLLAQALEVLAEIERVCPEANVEEEIERLQEMAIRKAVAAQREKDAKIAENFTSEYGSTRDEDVLIHTAEHIAAAIRKGES